jgi:general stress protein 26
MAAKPAIQISDLQENAPMSEITDRAEAISKLREMIQDINVAMLTTAMPDGTLRSRPMMTQQTEFDGDLWFFTGAGSPKIQEIEDDQHVNLSYAAPDDNRYVSVSGRATPVRNRRKAEELWKPMYKAWFPKGLDDSDLSLLKVSVEQAEYWDTSSNTLVHLVGFARAVATGEKYEPGENEKINL